MVAWSSASLSAIRPTMSRVRATLRETRSDLDKLADTGTARHTLMKLHVLYPSGRPEYALPMLDIAQHGAEGGLRCGLDIVGRMADYVSSP